MNITYTPTNDEEVIHSIQLSVSRTQGFYIIRMTSFQRWFTAVYFRTGLKGQGLKYPPPIRFHVVLGGHKIILNK